MVGKLSDDRLMSGSRIPVLYSWLIAKEGHPYSTPNDELRRSIMAKHGEYKRDESHSEPAYMGNLFEPAIVADVCEHLGLPDPELSPSVFHAEDGSWQCSLDGLVTLPSPTTVFADDTVEIDGGLPCVTLEGPIPIECKTTEAHFTGEIPLWRGPIQLQMQMMSVNAKFGIIATVHRGNMRHYKIVKCDPVMQQVIGDLCLDFRDRVSEERYYPPVNVDDCAKTHPEVLREWPPESKTTKDRVDSQEGEDECCSVTTANSKREQDQRRRLTQDQLTDPAQSRSGFLPNQAIALD